MPGLHSILSKIDVTVTEGCTGSRLGYAVKRFQPMLQSVTLDAVGPGLVARVEGFVRPRPVEQRACGPSRRWWSRVPSRRCPL